jgi:dehydrodolichyl diphosphate syntase complex subunit NUS1
MALAALAARVLQATILQAYVLGRSVQHGCSRCRRRCTPCCRGTPLTPPQQLERLRLRAAEFGKLPAHVALVLDCGEELGRSRAAGPAPPLTDEGDWILQRLAETVCWCASLGIATLSIYDADGCLVSSADHLLAEVEKQKLRAELPGLHAEVCRGQWQPERQPSHRAAQGGSHINVTILTAADGLEDLALATRRLAAASASAASAAAGPAAVSENLSAYAAGTAGAEFGDGPELLLRFTRGGVLASALTSDAFPPWYLRLTEIHHQEAFGEFCWEDFLRSLHRYARCEQRFGT